MKVLFVCTGNICRSPTAEGVFLHRAASAGLAETVTADSAGVSAEERGNPPDRRAVRTAATRGYRLPDRRARRIEPADYHSFDLLLGMDRGHVARMGQMSPPGATARIELFLAYAPETGLQDVPDPWYGDGHDFARALDLIEAGVDGLIARILRDHGR